MAEMEHAAPETNLKSIGRATKQIQRALQEEHEELMKKAIMKPEDLVVRMFPKFVIYMEYMTSIYWIYIGNMTFKGLDQLATLSFSLFFS